MKNIKDKLSALESLNSDMAELEEVQTIIRGKKRNGGIDWNEVRKAYVYGKRTSETDAVSGITRIWTETYSYKELAEIFEITPNKLITKAVDEGWYDFRQAYLARATEDSFEREMSYYENEDLLAEQTALGTSKKIVRLVNRAIENKYGQLLSSQPDDVGYGEEEDTNIDLKDLDKALTILQGVYTLQNKVLKEAPRNAGEILREVTKKKNIGKLGDERERERLKKDMMKTLRLLNTIETDEN